MYTRDEIEDAVGSLLAEGWAIDGVREYSDVEESKEIVLSIGDVGARLVLHHGLFFADVRLRDQSGSWYNVKDVLRAAGETAVGPLVSFEEAVASLKGAGQRVGTYLKDPSIVSQLGVRADAVR